MTKAINNLKGLTSGTIAKYLSYCYTTATAIFVALVVGAMIGTQSVVTQLFGQMFFVALAPIAWITLFLFVAMLILVMAGQLKNDY